MMSDRDTDDGNEGLDRIGFSLIRISISLKDITGISFNLLS